MQRYRAWLFKALVIFGWLFEPVRSMATTKNSTNATSTANATTVLGRFFFPNSLKFPGSDTIYIVLIRKEPQNMGIPIYF